MEFISRHLNRYDSRSQKRKQWNLYFLLPFLVIISSMASVPCTFLWFFVGMGDKQIFVRLENVSIAVFHFIASVPCFKATVVRPCTKGWRAGRSWFTCPRVIERILNQSWLVEFVNKMWTYALISDSRSEVSGSITNWPIVRPRSHFFVFDCCDK
jgi:hypothetical protein